MVSILAFDSRSIAILLSPGNEEFFEDKVPVIYKNRILKKNQIRSSNKPLKYFYRTSIDNALRNNQIRAVQQMIDFIVKYQNNYVSSFIFTKNFSMLMTRGVAVAKLFDSCVFTYNFDFD